VVSTEPFRLLAVRAVGDYATLDQAYERLFGSVFAHYPFERLAGVFGILYDDPRFDPAAACVSDCAVDVGKDAVPTGEADVLNLPAGPHLRLRHTGPYALIQVSADLLYASAIQMGLAIADHPFWIHYVDTPESAPEEALRSDLYLPLQKETTP
jgi:AraC family transcriptional regulator